MNILFQMLILTIVQAVSLFKFLPPKWAALSLIVLLALEALVIGFIFSPGKDSKVPAQFDEMATALDEVRAIQSKVITNIGNKNELRALAPEFKQKVESFKTQFQDKDLEPSMKDLFSISIQEFEAYYELLLIAGEESADPNKEQAASQKSTQLSAASKMQLQSVGLQIKALEKGFPYSVAVGIVLFIEKATKGLRQASLDQ